LNRKPTNVDQHVGRRIRQLRIHAAMSQSALGAALGITISAVQQYENGAHRISAGRLWDVAHVFGVPIVYFFEGLSDEHPASFVPLSPMEKEHITYLRRCAPPIRDHLMALPRHVVIELESASK
jgi:transcriptional regulator with XRE-family HTH domain